MLHITGIVVLTQKKKLGTDLTSFLGLSVSLQLISATKADNSSGKGLVGPPAYLIENVDNFANLGVDQAAFKIHFDHDLSHFGIPGAFYIKNFLSEEFFLVSLTLLDIPNHGSIHFVCNSWISNVNKYQTDRIFFTNNTYLPSKTPHPLVYYRKEELLTLRGDGTGERHEGERIYDYDVYNDLADPDRDADLARPVLGGSTAYPYPRRGRTGRPPTHYDPNTESRPEDGTIKFYVPRDEDFGQLNPSDSLAYELDTIGQDVLPAIESAFDNKSIRESEFNSFQDVYDLFSKEKEIDLPADVISQITHVPVLRELFTTDGDEQQIKQITFPAPLVIQANKFAWETDEEFAREIIAGVHPVVIRRLQEFPPKSNLDSAVFGDHTSTITTKHLEPNMDGVTVDEAIKKMKLFILDDHEAIMPFLTQINSTTSKAYATRTLFYLKDDGTLKPLAIELSLPHPDGDQHGVVSKVYLPKNKGDEGYITWLLAKAYVVVNDANYHQLVSHWLNTHAAVEPFVIATNRQLSVVHPIHKLLSPHYRNTMNINANARKVLINAGKGGGSGATIEKTFLPGKYSMAVSSAMYKTWIFQEQALPADLIKRGMAVKDENSPHGVRLVLKDYPYADDGLEIWGAISTWVQDYVSLYYPSDDAIKHDSELQSWWKEVVEVGHADKKDEPWWPKMQNRKELIESCTTLIWIASALHAAINFGQYPYGGLLMNRPTRTRRFMPEEGAPSELDDEKAYLLTVTSKPETLQEMFVMATLSVHVPDEQYIGQRDSEYWTSDTKALEAFNKFGKRLAEIELELIERNKNDKQQGNRIGPVEMPYTLLYPTSGPGMTFRGIPNSISI